MYTIYSEKTEKTYLRVREKVGFSVKRIGILKLLMPQGVLGSLLERNNLGIILFVNIKIGYLFGTSYSQATYYIWYTCRLLSFIVLFFK
jgi:hypothetical protein